MSAERPYRGVTADVRRGRRRAALLEAALDLMGEATTDISVRGVCSRAGLTQRYFYESFSNLDELLVVLLDQIAEEVSMQGTAALADRPPSDLYDACLTAFEGAYSVLENDPRKARALLRIAAAAPELNDIRRRIALTYADAMASFLGAAYGKAVDSPRSRVILTYAVGGALEVTHAVLNGDLRLSGDELSALVAALLESSVEQLPLDTAGDPV